MKTLITIMLIATVFIAGCASAPQTTQQTQNNTQQTVSPPTPDTYQNLTTTDDTLNSIDTAVDNI